MITNTANIRIYRVRHDVDINELITFLTNEKGYNQINFIENIQKTQGVIIQALARENKLEPEWVRMIKPYLTRPITIGGFFKYDFIT